MNERLQANGQKSRGRDEVCRGDTPSGETGTVAACRGDGPRSDASRGNVRHGEVRRDTTRRGASRRNGGRKNARGRAKRSDRHDSPFRCAIYTRKSTSEGLDQAFNSLDAQRESCEAFVTSQKHEGWVALDTKYDDGGFSGGTIERPALQNLMDDIESGEIDCVVVYKVDRLSRSLLDFARIMKLFEDMGIHFVSVTQHFNTADSMGRLTLNILLSFAQFEREIIGERTRDKIAAARRKGKWSGGRPILGYDLDTKAHRLKVNPEEAKQVRAIFQIYVQQESLIATAQEAGRLGYTTKVWTTSKGAIIGGKPFDKTRMNHLLRNVAYLGQVRYRDEVYEGEQDAIVDEVLWDTVQSILTRNATTAGAFTRNKHGALLKGLLKCSACNVAMTHSVANRGNRQHRYYVCTYAQKNGHGSCPTKSVNANAIETAVLDRVRQIPIDETALDASSIAEAGVLFGEDDKEMSGRERARLLRLVLDRVDYDGRTKRMMLSLTDELSQSVRASA